MGVERTLLRSLRDQFKKCKDTLVCNPIKVTHTDKARSNVSTLFKVKFGSRILDLSLDLLIWFLSQSVANILNVYLHSSHFFDARVA